MLRAASAPQSIGHRASQERCAVQRPGGMSSSSDEQTSSEASGLEQAPRRAASSRWAQTHPVPATAGPGQQTFCAGLDRAGSLSWRPASLGTASTLTGSSTHTPGAEVQRGGGCSWRYATLLLHLKYCVMAADRLAGLSCPLLCQRGGGSSGRDKALQQQAASRPGSCAAGLGDRLRALQAAQRQAAQATQARQGRHRWQHCSSAHQHSSPGHRGCTASPACCSGLRFCLTALCRPGRQRPKAARPAVPQALCSCWCKRPCQAAAACRPEHPAEH